MTATYRAVLPGIDASAPQGIPRPRMSNPMPVAFALFGFALCLYGVHFLNVGPTTVASGAAWFVMARDLYRILGLFVMAPQAYQAR